MTREYRIGKYAAAIRTQFVANRTSSGPASAIYFYAFTAEGVSQLADDVMAALHRLGGNVVKMDCGEMRYSEIQQKLLGELGHTGHRSARDRYEALRSALASQSVSVLLTNLSKMKETKRARGLMARELIQFFVDEYWHGGAATNGLVISDVPGFLETNMDKFGHVVRPVSAVEDIFLIDPYEGYGPTPV